MTEIGDRKWSFLITPVGPLHHRHSVSAHWSNADTSRDARETARRMLHSAEYRGMGMTHVTVSGSEHVFTGDAWVPVKGVRGEYFTVKPEDVGAPPAWVTDARRCLNEGHETAHAMLSDGTCQCGNPAQGRRCYDSTAMDYFETVHAILPGGTCVCGDPTRNVR